MLQHSGIQIIRAAWKIITVLRQFCCRPITETKTNVVSLWTGECLVIESNLKLSQINRYTTYIYIELLFVTWSNKSTMFIIYKRPKGFICMRFKNWSKADFFRSYIKQTARGFYFASTKLIILFAFTGVVIFKIYDTSYRWRWKTNIDEYEGGLNIAGSLTIQKYT